MSYYLRQMSKQDIAQVTEIDREAFPTLWPPTDYRHELQNRLAHYVVACSDEKIVKEPTVKAVPEKGLPGLVYRIRRLFKREPVSHDESPASEIEHVAGFIGLWVIADEAHITNIAVRENYRRQGIGESLLISGINLAKELKASMVTLEVRVSNSEAQNLYYKYGFTQTGLRRGYYTDNKEDAAIMTVNNVHSPTFHAQLQQLKQAHFEKWGIALP